MKYTWACTSNIGEIFIDLLDNLTPLLELWCCLRFILRDIHYILHTLILKSCLFSGHTLVWILFFWQLQNEEETLDGGSAGHHHSTPKQSSVTLIEQIDEHQLNYISSDFTINNSVALVIIIPVLLVNMICSSNCCAISRNFRP